MLDKTALTTIFTYPNLLFIWSPKASGQILVLLGCYETFLKLKLPNYFLRSGENKKVVHP